MKSRIVLSVIICLLLTAAIAQAHHSQAATYDSSRQVKLEGKLLQFLFRNPHSFVQVEAPDEHGVIQRWSIEWGGAASLGNQGVQKDTLKVGDHIVITGNPSRSPGELRMKMNTMRRPADGFTWGTRPGEVVD